MKSLITAAVAATCLVSFVVPAYAASNKANAPGQDRACLVTTGTPGNFNDDQIVDAKWLPRKAAEKQASKDPSTMIVNDYADDSLVGEGKTYATGEELCNEHFN